MEPMSRLGHHARSDDPAVLADIARDLELVPVTEYPIVAGTSWMPEQLFRLVKACPRVASWPKVTDEPMFAALGLLPGDLVTGINGRVPDAARVRRGADTIVLEIRRHDSTRVLIVGPAAAAPLGTPPRYVDRGVASHH
jgi:hypothetical protein